MSRFRKLKIHSKFRTRRWGNTTIPEIRLEGKWLDELGFKQGQVVIIEQEQNKLTIRLDNGEITMPNSG
jgi:toxic protein SymE